jgi:antitoxin VapB
MPATLTVPNLPDELHCWLSEQAANHHRSIDSEVIALLLTLQNGKAAKPKMSPDQIIAITARCKALPDHDTRSPDEIIGYDEFGIPS